MEGFGLLGTIRCLLDMLCCLNTLLKHRLCCLRKQQYWNHDQNNNDSRNNTWFHSLLLSLKFRQIDGFLSRMRQLPRQRPQANNPARERR